MRNSNFDPPKSNGVKEALKSYDYSQRVIVGSSAGPIIIITRVRTSWECQNSMAFPGQKNYFKGNQTTLGPCKG